MDAEPDGSRPNPYPPPEARRRLLARLTDIALPLALVAVAPVAHATIAFTLFGAALLLCADSLFGPGRSLGKRLFGLRTILLETRRPAPTLAGMKRNLPFALALLPALLPHAFARVEAVAMLAVVLAIEAAYALRPLARDLGQRRLGDLWAGTQVIDASIALQLPSATPVQTRRALAPSPPAVRQHQRPAARAVAALLPRAASREPGAALPQALLSTEEPACASP